MQINKLYYFMDPMCGWCYGFTSQMETIRNNFREIPFEIICGGMVPPTNEGPVGEKGSYIFQALHRVEDQSGVKFGEAYKNGIAAGTIWNGSLKPSVAVNIMKSYSMEDAFLFSKQLQHAYFVEGLSLNEDSTYMRILEEKGINPSEFLYLMGETNWVQKTLEEFSYTGQVGITGFPTLVGEMDSKLVLVTYGYSSAEKIETFLLDLQTANEA